MYTFRYHSLIAQDRAKLEELYKLAEYMTTELRVMKRAAKAGEAVSFDALLNKIKRTSPGMYYKIDRRFFMPAGGLQIVVNEDAFAGWVASRGIQFR